MAISERLDKAMRLRRLSQGQLAAKSGVSQSHISRILRGQRDPSLDPVVRLADALGVSVDWLAGRDIPAGEALTPEEDELLQRFRRIHNPALREAALQNILSLAEAQS